MDEAKKWIKIWGIDFEEMARRRAEMEKLRLKAIEDARLAALEKARKEEAARLLKLRLEQEEKDRLAELARIAA